MRKSKIAAFGAVTMALALVASACGSSGGGSTTTGSSGSSGGSSTSGYNAALTGDVNPQTGVGGTLTYVNAADWDSIDTGNTYDAFSWDFSRLYARTLLGYTQKPGAAGLVLVPDLATALPTSNATGTQWTFHLQPDATYQNGQKITSADVKYAIERSNWGQDTLSNGPAYFKDFVQDTTKYAGPYKDTNPADGVSGILTPDPDTIVFNLTQPFASFPYLAAMSDTAPVPRASDTGATYYEHYVSSGQYEIQSYTVGKQAVLVPNPNFVKASDPLGLHQVHASKIVAEVKVDPSTVDQDLLHGDAQVDMGGVGVQSQTQGQILANPTLKADSDDPLTGFLTYMAINDSVKPFDNVDCRKAVELAVNKNAVQSALGGSVGGGDIASTILPPTVAGYEAANAYPTPGNGGDIAAAQAEMTKCQTAEPASFTNGKVSVALGSFSDQPKMKPVAAAIQQSLAQIGINVDVQLTPFGTYYSQNGGNAAYVTSHRLAFSVAGWGADFPNGYGFLDQIITSDGTRPAGATNLSDFDDPTIDALIAKGNATINVTAQNAIWAQVDQAVMAQAAIVPLVYNRSLFYRPSTATNVHITEAYGMYDYATIGVS
jgi:peptide/nickel transport system substrate-binding protein